MIDAKRLAEQMTPKGMRMLAKLFDGLSEKWADRDAAVLREVADLKSRTSMEIRDATPGKEFIFRAMYSEMELRERVGQSHEIVSQCGHDVRRRFEEELSKVLPEIRKG